MKKEKLVHMKDKVIDIAKKTFQFFKTNPLVTSLIAYCIAILGLVLVGVLALQEYVISVCVLMILETLMAVLLHKVELWKHGILLVAHIIAGIIIGRIPLIIVCVMAYIAAIVALHFMFKKTKTSPKA